MSDNLRPLITIGIPFYNNETTLAYAVKSVLLQTYTNFEIILINDGSKDRSLDIAQSFAAKDIRIKLISDGINKGLIARLNQIIDLASGEYIGRMDADDMLDPTRFEKQIHLLHSNPEVDVVSTGLVSMTNIHEPMGKRCCQKQHPEVYQIFQNGDGIMHASIMTRTVWFKHNKYMEGFERAEDRELFTRTYNGQNFYVITEPLYYYLDIQNITLKKYLMSYRSDRKSLLKNWKRKLKFKQVIYLYLLSITKSIAIRFYFLLNIQESLFINKNQRLSEEELLRIKKNIEDIKKHDD